MNYFGQVVSEILENNKFKSYFGNLETEILSIFLDISQRRKLSMCYSRDLFLKQKVVHCVLSF